MRRKHRNEERLTRTLARPLQDQSSQEGQVEHSLLELFDLVCSSGQGRNSFDREADVILQGVWIGRVEASEAASVLAKSSAS